MPRQCFPVLLTRPAAQNAQFAAMLDGPVVCAPLAQVEWLDADLPNVQGMVFTSANGVAGLRGRRPAGRAWCVGARTAQAARDAGFDAVSADGDADALSAAIIAAGERGPLLHARGAVSRGDVAARLTAAGVPCAEAVVYRLCDAPLTDAALDLLRGDGPVVVPLFSPASAVRFTRAAKDARAPLLLACLSPAVAAFAPPAAAVRIAATPDAGAMLNAIAAMQSLETWGKQG